MLITITKQLFEPKLTGSGPQYKAFPFRNQSLMYRASSTIARQVAANEKYSGNFAGWSESDFLMKGRSAEVAGTLGTKV